jgi:hypothetical protein
MKTTTLQLLPTTTFRTPSANYDVSSLDWSGDAQQAANYYGGFGGLQTIAFYLSGFQGRIKIEASLESNPSVDADWFKISEFDSTTTQTTENFSRNITGNFTWIRANVELFENGTINKLYISY